MRTITGNTAVPGGWRFWMDQGGTFTDCIGISPEREIHLAKVLSGPLAPLACIRKILQLREEEAVPPAEIRLGTTLATNALLERRGHAHALLISAGFADALEIGTQQRPDLFALDIRKPKVLYACVAEAIGRLEPDGSESRPLDLDALRTDLVRLRMQGVDGLAIVLLHGYAFPAHEKAAADCAREAGFTRISCSHEVNPEIGLTARGDTTTVDAYLYSPAGRLPGHFARASAGFLPAADAVQRRSYRPGRFPRAQCHPLGSGGRRGRLRPPGGTWRLPQGLGFRHGGNLHGRFPARGRISKKSTSGRPRASASAPLPWTSIPWRRAEDPCAACSPAG